jgi:MarR family transcriptional regulator, transcriptional regulator for hemolysin
MASSSSPSTEPTLGSLLHDVARLMRRRFALRAREAALPLSRSQCSVLFRVALDEGMRQATLAQILDMEPITLVRLIDRLEQAGLLERRLNPRDRRVRMLYLTPAARPVLKQIHRLAAMVHDEACADLPMERREALMADLGRLKANLSNKQCLENPAAETIDVVLLASS